MKRFSFPALLLPVISLLIFSCSNRRQPGSLAVNDSDKVALPLPAQDTAALHQQLQQIAAAIDGMVGVSVIDVQTGTVVNLNGDGHFPMQSVYKFPLAMAVLDQVDKGRLSLDQKITLTKRDLLPNTHSPLRDKYEKQGTPLTIKELLTYSVSQSDNNACDILFRLIGGTKPVNDHIHGLSVKDMMIVATEEEMHKAWDVQFTNWSTPAAMSSLLQLLYSGKALSKSSNDLLLQLMRETSTGPNRIKGLLPQGTIVAHKTGTSDTKDGVTGAVNDAGIVTLPDGRHFIITVFISNSKAPAEKIEQAIAKIAKAAWDSFQPH